MTKILILLSVLSIFIENNLIAQKDTIKNGSDIYQDLKKKSKIKDAQIILVLNGDKVLIDTLTLKKINPNWLEKIDILTTDTSSKIENVIKPTVMIYIRQKDIKETKRVIDIKNK